MSVKKYFGNIIDVVRTTAVGMGITLKYWVKESPITVEYPDRVGGKRPEDLVADRYRGFLGIEPDSCIGCLQCMKECPINCILVETQKREEGRYLNRFDVDQAKCMYCGLCVEVCPTGAVHFTRRYEGACYDISELLIHHITVPVPVAKPRKAAQEGDK